MSALLITENFPPRVGGSGRWFWELYRRLPRAAVVVAAGSCPGDVAFDGTHDLRLTRLPLNFAELGIASPAAWLAYRRAARAVRRLCEQSGASVLHCGRVLPEGWLALGRRLPFACFVHGEELASNRTSRQLTWMARRVFQRAALLIANSRHTAALLEREWGVAPARIAVLHPGVDTSRLVPAPADEAARSGLGWAGRMVILTVARLQKRKGHDRLIEAVAVLRRRFPTLLYAVVGDGPERTALAAQVRAAGLADHVSFHGELDEAQLVRAYQQCDLFALPNRTADGDFEGFGMVLLEAQACGRAVLCGSSGGTAEAVRDGETAVVLDCAAAAPLAAALADLLADAERRAALGAAGRRLAVEQFDFDRRAEQAAAVLARVHPT